MSTPRALLVSLPLLACRTPTPPRAHAPQPPREPTQEASAPAPTIIERSDALPTDDGRRITACGALDSTSVGPRGSPGTLVLWGLRFADEPRIGLFLRAPWPGAEDDAAPDAAAPPGSTLCATGTFYTQYPLAPGDPPHAARFSGRWLFDVVLRPR